MTNLVRLSLRLTFVVGVLASLCFGIWSFQQDYKRQKTIARIKQTYTMLSVVGENYHTNVALIIKDRVGSAGDLNQVLYALVTEPDYFISHSMFRTNLISDPLVDSWGHPLEVIWRDDAASTNISGRLMQSSASLLIIWSTGPNGINEYGNGD